MLSRNIKIALILSIVIHLGMMSVVKIVTPGGARKLKPFTRVTFLGPVLKKTAFDIMLENMTPVARTNYAEIDSALQEGYLKVVAPKVRKDADRFPVSKETGMEKGLLNFFSSRKSVPDFLLGMNQGNLGVSSWAAGLVKDSAERKVVYKPGEPMFIKGLYGDKDSFEIKVKVLVGPSGDVIKAEPLTTTGYPELDITAVEHVKEWLFEPDNSQSGQGEWMTVLVVLK